MEDLVHWQKSPLRRKDTPFLLKKVKKTVVLAANWKWLITFATAIAMAAVNLIEILVTEVLVLWKFGLMEWLLPDSPEWIWFASHQYHDIVFFVLGVGALVGMCSIYAVIGISIIEFFAPNCSGSGLTENKCYLTGTPIEEGPLKGFFTLRTLIVRISSSILANAAGYPVGREGPTVVIGSNVGYLITQYSLVIRARWNKNMDLDEEYLGYLTRGACAVGGACGMSMIFNTPVGGILYMFEEITATRWPVDLTFRTFVATCVSALLSFWMLLLIRKSVHDFVIYAFEPREAIWHNTDIQFFMLIAGIIGAVSAMHTKGMLFMAGYRKRTLPKDKKGIIRSTVFFNLACPLLSVIASLLFGTCRHGKDGGTYVQFNCQAGYYNEVATILINTSHSAVKMLFACESPDNFDAISTFTAFVVYCFLNVTLSGLPVPGGAFTGTMLMGGLLGRAGGFLLYHYTPLTTAHPGVYAVVGCAAMLCGFKRMTATAVLIIITTVNNVNVAVPVMVSVTVSMFINRYLQPRGHDEEQISGKKLPFLESCVPEDLCHTHCVAGECCDPAGKIYVESSMEGIKNVLGHAATHYPIIDGVGGGHCIGLLQRRHLEEICLEGSDLSASQIEERLTSCMDKTPLTLLKDMPVDRFYEFFAAHSVQAASVISPTGECIGVLTRQCLINAGYSAEEEEHSRRH